MVGLGTLGGDTSDANRMSANGLVIVGSAENGSFDDRAFRWTQAGGMQDLGTLGGDESEALGVSGDGSIIVGWAEDSGYESRAFRWRAGVGMENLNTVFAGLLTDGSLLYEARAISPDGLHIVGYGYNAATERDEGFLLTIPEPATAVLLAGGVAVLAARRGRRRR